jgi:hypothetical protein
MIRETIVGWWMEISPSCYFPFSLSSSSPRLGAVICDWWSYIRERENEYIRFGRWRRTNARNYGGWGNRCKTNR